MIKVIFLINSFYKLKVLILEEFQCIFTFTHLKPFLIFILYYYVLLLSSNVDLIETMLLVYKLITNSLFSWNPFSFFDDVYIFVCIGFFSIVQLFTTHFVTCPLKNSHV
jgi:hypothetical protein